MSDDRNRYQGGDPTLMGNDNRSREYDDGRTANEVRGSGWDDNRDGMGRDQTDQVRADETHKLISADKVQGTAVYGQDGEKIGHVDQLMINKQSGKVAYAVMSFGGFLGIGERYHPLPWDVLTYDTSLDGYRVNLTRDQLEGGPSFGADEGGDYDYGQHGAEIDDWYRGAGNASTGSSGMASGGYGETDRSLSGSGAMGSGGTMGGTGATGGVGSTGRADDLGTGSTIGGSGPGRSDV